MSRTYWRVSPAFWSDEKVSGCGDYPGWSDDAKILALYLLTCEHRNVAGLFRVPKGYICDDLGWERERLAKPLGELLRDGFIEYDEKARLCLIVNTLEYQAPENENQIKATIKALAELPDSSLFARLFEQAERFAKPFAERLRERLGERIGKPTATAITTATATTTLSEGASQSDAQPVDNSDAPDDDFADIDFGEEEPEEPKKPEPKLTPGQELVGYYARAADIPGAAKPTDRQKGIVAQIVGQKVKGGVKPDLVRKALFELVDQGQEPQRLAALVDKWAAAHRRSGPTSTFPEEPPPEITEADRRAGAEIIREARRQLKRPAVTA